MNATHQFIEGIISARSEQLFYLRDRWQDEKEYEDFDEYVVAFAKLFDNIECMKPVSFNKYFRAELTYVPTGAKVELKIGARRISISITE